MLPQALQHGPDDKAPHQSLAAEAHLALCRMHVHVHLGGIEVKEEHRDRIAALGQRSRVGFDHRVVQRATIHRAAVDEHQHLVPRGAVDPGFADQPAEFETAVRTLEWQQVGRQLPAEDFRHPLAQGHTDGGLKQNAAVLDQGETRLRTGQSVEPHRLDDVRRLGGVAFQKLAAGRHRVEKVGYRDPRAGGQAALAHMHELAAVDEDLGARRGLDRTRAQLETRDAGDGRHGLAAKAKGVQPVEVGRLHQLAGGVSLKRHQGVVLGHATAVVLDADQAASAVAELDLDAGGTGIEGILHQFLHDRRGTLNHFAGGDLVGNPVGEDANGGHGMMASQRAKNPGWREPRA